MDPDSSLGTNLQALLDHTQNANRMSAAEIVLVISNKDGVQGLKRAEAAGIPTKVCGVWMNCYCSCSTGHARVAQHLVQTCVTGDQASGLCQPRAVR